MSREELQQENEQLHAIIEDRDEDLKEIARTLYQMLNALGLTNEDLSDQKKAKKKVMKELGSITSELIFNSKAVEERFSFLKNFQPLFEKHQGLIDQIKEEQNNNE